MGNQADNRFQKIGSEYVQNALKWPEIRDRYTEVCIACCVRPDGGNCEHCPVRESFLSKAKIYKDEWSEKDKKFIEAERDLL